MFSAGGGNEATKPRQRRVGMEGVETSDDAEGKDEGVLPVEEEEGWGGAAAVEEKEERRKTRKSVLLECEDGAVCVIYRSP